MGENPKSDNSSPPAPPRVDLQRFTPALITWAAHRLAANNSGVYRERFDVTLMEWRVLLHLTAEPRATAAHLAQNIGFDKATISRTVDSLRRRDLLIETLNPNDARSSCLELTAAGAQLYNVILPVAIDQEHQLLGDLTDQEAGVFIELLVRVVKALRQSSRKVEPRRSPTAGAMRRSNRKRQSASE